jgi:hypothetical protein
MSDPGAGPKWIKLNPVQAAKAYDSVRDRFSKIGVPIEGAGESLHRDTHLDGKFERRCFGRLNLRFLLGRVGGQGISAEEIAQRTPRSHVKNVVRPTKIRNVSTQDVTPISHCFRK